MRFLFIFESSARTIDISTLGLRMSLKKHLVPGIARKLDGSEPGLPHFQTAWIFSTRPVSVVCGAWR